MYISLSGDQCAAVEIDYRAGEGTGLHSEEVGRGCVVGAGNKANWERATELVKYGGTGILVQMGPGLTA
jgi:hypothetical protein